MKNFDQISIAQRYVKALFDAAEAALALGAVEADLVALGKALAQSAEFRHFLSNPLVSLEQQVNTLNAIATEMQAHAVTRQFLALLAKQKRLNILQKTIVLFAQAATQARGELDAQLISSGTLSKQDVALVSAGLAKACGKKVNLDLHEDPALLGGIVVKIGGLQLDGSLAGKLNRLGMALKAA